MNFYDNAFPHTDVSWKLLLFRKLIKVLEHRKLLWVSTPKDLFFFNIKTVYLGRVHFESLANSEYCDVGGKALEYIFPAMSVYKADAVVNMYSQKAGISAITTFNMFL